MSQGMASDSHAGPLSAPLDRTQVAEAVERTRQYLLGQQDPAGFWCGELEGDTILESEYILLLAWLGRANTLRAQKAARYLVRQQQGHGGWSQFPGGELDISVSVKAYFALKLTGHDPEADYMKSARDAIRVHGGADAVNSFTRFYLALLGQISYEHCPAVPPEAMLLPDWAPINIYKISAWSRTIFVPLAIMWAHRPTCKIPAEQGIRELFLREPAEWPELRCPGLTASRRLFSWERTFRTLDRALKWLERRRIRPLRSRAIRLAKEWMLARFVESDGLGAIFPPIIWSIIALRCLGYDEQSLELRYNFEQLEGLVIEEDETVRLQPCKSPVWDTAIALRALAAAGVKPESLAAGRALEWLLKKEVHRRGDWAKTVRAAPGGWFFEHQNAFYPDVDDTAMVLLALREQFDAAWRDVDAKPSADAVDVIDIFAPQPPRTVLAGLFGPREGNASSGTQVVVATAKVADLPTARARALLWQRVASACDRGRKWIEAMQNRDGGWGAFDRNNDREFLCHVPFADHNAMIDPSTPDLTARVLEALGAWGMRVGDPMVDEAVAYIRSTQEPDGAWQGRWGVNHIYGTWQTLVGLAAVGMRKEDLMLQRGANWLERYQQASGGWGESAASYADPAQRGRGNATASQTAWALLGLMAAGRTESHAVNRGIQYLLETQVSDGRWNESEFTGTGFPRVFYLRYHLYAIYFPLLALAQWSQVQAPLSH